MSTKIKKFKRYRIVNVLGGFEDNKKITDSNPFNHFKTLDEAKKGLIEFYEKYINSLEYNKKLKEESSVFLYDSKDELDIFCEGNKICHAKIYEIEYISIVQTDNFDNTHISNSINYRNYKCKLKTSWRIYKDNRYMSSKFTDAEALDYIDWLSLILENKE